MAKVFISYDRDDSDFAELVQGRLEKAGHGTSMDIEILNAGDDWRDELDQAIRDSHALVVIMTPHAEVSEYVAYEWAFALGACVKIIPLELKASTFHPRLEVLQRLDFTDKARPWQALLAEVAKASEAKPVTTVAVSPSAPPTVQHAVKALDSLDEDEQRAGVKSLAQTDHPAARKALAEALQHPVKNVRITAALEFPDIGDPKRLPGLIDEFRENWDSKYSKMQHHHRWSWCNQVVAMGPSAIPYLLEALQDQSIYVRSNIAFILGKIGDVSAVPRLIDALQNEKEAYVRPSVVKALGKIGDTTAIPALRDALLKDPSDDTRVLAIEALGELNDSAVAGELLQYLQDDTEARQVHVASALVLGQLGAKAAVPKLKQLLQNKDEFEDIRESAAEALGLLGDKSVVDYLRELFENENANSLLALRAGEALIRLQGAEAFSFIIEVMKEVSFSNIAPVNIIEMMAAMGEPAIPALHDVLRITAFDYMSKTVATALKTIGTPEALAVAKQWERGKINIGFPMSGPPV